MDGQDFMLIKMVNFNRLEIDRMFNRYILHKKDTEWVIFILDMLLLIILKLENIKKEDSRITI